MQPIDLPAQSSDTESRGSAGFRRDNSVDDTLERLTGSSILSKEEDTGSLPGNKEDKESDVSRTSLSRSSPSNAMPSRGSPLSWQRRPNSQSTDQPRSRPLSMVAVENAARSPRSTPAPEDLPSTESTVSREQIAQSLASKDPDWFKQTSDRGRSSPAYRRNQVEDEERSHHESSSPIQLPGMSRKTPDVGNEEQSSSLPRYDGASDDGSRASQSTISGGFRSSVSLLPSSSSQKLDPPSDLRGLAMSPSQGRISPERLDRPISPTKGMGGFVQSAMMKRSDSVSKRWSVQATPGLQRGNSVASNRSSRDISTSTTLSGGGNSIARDRPGGGQSKDESPRSLSRPGSSQANAKTAPDDQRPGTSSSIRSSNTVVTNDGFVKPPLPHAQVSQEGKEKPQVDAQTPTETTPPTSPSKTMDPRRWSPTKSSWLESALNKPESPKPKQPVASQQQPAWMSELNRTKKASVDLGRAPTVARKHEVNISGLLRSPTVGSAIQPVSIGGHSDRAASAVPSRNDKESDLAREVKSVGTKEIPDTLGEPSLPNTKPTPTGGKIKPETPPKKDFKAGLKPRQPAPVDSESKEPEFKAVFGQLRRTKTQNYVAPDELKDNITRGKAALNVTGGPKKTERRDEFKDAILKKKEDFRKTQLEGKGVTRSSTIAKNSTVPEAIAKKQALGSGTLPAKGSEPSSTDGSPTLSKPPKPIPLQKEISAPARLQGGKLADRFNPALAGILARGPPPLSSNGSPQTSSSTSQPRESSNVSADDENTSKKGPQLTHMTKGRARGPKRKAPTQITIKPPTTEVADPPSKPNKSVNTDIKPRSIAQVKPAGSSAADLAGSSQLTQSDVEPSSPRKLDMKRRSQFLQEASSTPGQAESQNEMPSTPKPLQVTKKPAPEVPRKVSEAKSEVALQSPKPKPRTPSKSSELASKAFMKTGSADAAVPFETVKSISTPATARTVPVTEAEAEPVVSVKNAAARWNAPVAAQSSTPRTKSPVKLPTQKDEDNAMREAGLLPSITPKVSGTAGSNQNSTAESTVTNPSSMVENSSVNKPLAPAFPSSSAKSVPVRNTDERPAAQNTDTSKLLADFFTDRKVASKYTADTLGILSSAYQQTSVKSLRSSLFQLSDDGKKIPVPNHQERILFEGNMYLGFHTFGNAIGKKISEVYFWVGDDVSSEMRESGEKVAEREAKTSGSSLIKISQGKETSEFVQSLGGIIIIRRGTSNKYDSLAPHILCGRQYAGQIAFDEVDYSPTSLCTGFPYLISTPTGKCYLWKGKGSGIDELSCARLIGMDFGLTGELEEIEEGDEPTAFLSTFGSSATRPKSADHWRLKANYTKYRTRLFCADSALKNQVRISMSQMTQCY